MADKTTQIEGKDQEDQSSIAIDGVSNQSNSGFFISQVFKQAWRVFKQSWSTILLLFAGMIGVVLVYSFAVGDQPSPIYSLLYFLGQMLLGMIFLQAFINLYRGQDVSFDLVGRALPRIGHYFVGVVLYMLVVLGGMILLVIPSLYFALKYALVPFLIIDQEMSFSQAFKESGRLTKGAKWDMIGFYSAALILVYSGALALLVGLLVTIPTACLAFAGLYVKLVERDGQ